MRARAPSTLDFHHGLLVAREAPAAKQGDYPTPVELPDYTERRESAK